MEAFRKITIDCPNALFQLKRNGQKVTILAIVAKNELPHYKVYNHTSKAQGYEPIDEVIEYKAQVIQMFKPKNVPKAGEGA